MSVLVRMRTLGSAEEFFRLLDVPFDPARVDVCRLHILRRMGEYLRRQDFTGDDETVIAAKCRAVLATAYQDFIASSPLEQRVFKVLKDAVRPRGETFVPLSLLTTAAETPA
jgi:nitrogenase-stabilizing/protective protein